MQPSICKLVPLLSTSSLSSLLLAGDMLTEVDIPGAVSDLIAVGLNSLFPSPLPEDQLCNACGSSALGLKLALLPSSSVEGDDGWESDRLGLEVRSSGGGPFSSMEPCDPAEVQISKLH